MAPGPSFDPEAIEEALRCLPELELKGLFRRSSNYTFLAQVRQRGAPTGDGLLAVYKPARGESPLWDFPPGTLYRREVAAYVLAKFLGWPRIPPTVVREGARYGASVTEETSDWRQAYAAVEPFRRERPPSWARLPWA